MEKESDELDGIGGFNWNLLELTALEDAMQRNDMEFEGSETDSVESEESTYSNVPESKERRPVLSKTEWKRQIDKDFLELEDRILRGTAELEEALDDMESKKRKESETKKLEGRILRGTADLEEALDDMKSKKSKKSVTMKLEGRILRGTADLEEALDDMGSKKRKESETMKLEGRILRGTAELKEALDDMESKKIKESETMKLEDRNIISRPKGVEILSRQENENVLLESPNNISRKTFNTEETPQKENESETLKLHERDSLFKRIEEEISYKEANEKFILESQDRIVRKTLELEDAVAKRKASATSKKLEERNSVARRNFENEEEERQAEVHVPLMEEESVSVDLRDGRQSSQVDQVQTSANKKADLKNIFRSLSFIERSASQSSVFQQIKNAKANSKSPFDCCKRTFTVIGALFLYIIYVGGLSIVSIAMMVIGSMHLDRCPVQPHTPIYLAVGGAVGILYNFVTISRKCFCSKSSSYSCFDGIMNLFFLVWFILGCVWVYGVSHVEFYDTSDYQYCHKTVYYFAFWFLNSVFILLGASVVLCVCAACCASSILMQRR